MWYAIAFIAWVLLVAVFMSMMVAAKREDAFSDAVVAELEKDE